MSMLHWSVQILENKIVIFKYVLFMVDFLLYKKWYMLEFEVTI